MGQLREMLELFNTEGKFTIDNLSIKPKESKCCGKLENNAKEIRPIRECIFKQSVYNIVQSGIKTGYLTQIPMLMCDNLGIWQPVHCVNLSSQQNQRNMVNHNHGNCDLFPHFLKFQDTSTRCGGQVHEDQNRFCILIKAQGTFRNFSL